MVRKELHVSPFLSMDQRYRITASVPGESVAIRIESHTDDGLVLEAGLTATRQSITRHALGRLLWRHPMLTARVSARIYTEAARLALKGTPIHRHPSRPTVPRRIGRPTVSIRPPGRSVDCARARPTSRPGNAGDRGRGRHTPRLRCRGTDGRSSRARRPRLVSRCPPWVDRSRRVLRTGLVGLRRPHVTPAHRLRRLATCDTNARPHGDDDSALRRSGAAAQSDPRSARPKECPGALRHLQRLLRADARSDHDVLVRAVRTTTGVSGRRAARQAGPDLPAARAHARGRAARDRQRLGQLCHPRRLLVTAAA